MAVSPRPAPVRTPATRSPRLLPGLPLLAVSLAALAPSPGASQRSRPPLSTRQHDTDARVVLRLRRLEVRCREQVPASCGLPEGSDLAVLRYEVRNHGARPYAGHVELFSLVGRPAPPGSELTFSEQLDPEQADCGAFGSRRYPGGASLDPPLPAGRARRFHALFAIPRGATLARVLYHDDDFPTCLSAPRITYPEPACRPRPQPVDDVTCSFFER